MYPIGRGLNPDPVVQSFVATLENPNMAAVDAAEQRLRALDSLGALEVGLDAAQTAGARNSLEKMLAHQLAVSHLDALRLMKSSRAEGLAPADVVRYTNAAARLMESFQDGVLTLMKLKTNGQQRVVVQYVNVQEGGSALVAGNLPGRSRRRARGRRKIDG